MVELKQRYVVYLIDIDPDTGDVSQMKPVAYTEKDYYAETIANLLNTTEIDIPLREYKWTKLF